MNATEVRIEELPKPPKGYILKFTLNEWKFNIVITDDIIIKQDDNTLFLNVYREYYKVIAKGCKNNKVAKFESEKEFTADEIDKEWSKFLTKFLTTVCNDNFEEVEGILNKINFI